MNSRAKGNKGEVELVTILRGAGWPHAHRNFDSGSAGGGDIARGPAGVALECKRHGGRLDLPKAWAQAVEGAVDGEIPVVAHRRDRGPWLATLELDELLPLLRLREAA